MEVLIDFIFSTTYHGLGRLVFGKSFDTGEKVPLWKKIFLIFLAVVLIFALLALFGLGVNYFKK
ncbi:MAG: hypothetical protein A2622_07910 [Bdellovibrionales bacterium RIFCSPHIGHO2_01_FULL_40_29]|nr:MAG: hypothetical protein A2622_07910 [Bdellovibrionales bacterium RIFCSPHIGHO2_01_FULL_40_29]OFZ33730.1 MAG: hypothetical protein A3D17_10000 [Bdellovibrionales bacterium RIFCSPHIGHO2_02_FULL_40_15]